LLRKGTIRMRRWRRKYKNCRELDRGIIVEEEEDQDEEVEKERREL